MSEEVPADRAAHGARIAVAKTIIESLQAQIESLLQTAQLLSPGSIHDYAENLHATLQSRVDNIDFEAIRTSLEASAVHFPSLDVPAIDFERIRSELVALARTFESADIAGLKRSMVRACPPNWQDLGDDLALTALMDITAAGLPTAWVPRASILQELISTTAAERASVFAERRQEVIKDCRAALNDVTSPELVDQVDMLNEALDVAELDRLFAAQALAAAVFDTVLRRTIKPKRMRDYYGDVKNRITKRGGDYDLSGMRWWLVHLPVTEAIDLFNQPKGDPVPPNFSRHASVHAAGRIQYTPANAVIALALATSLVREAHQEIVDVAEGAA